MRAKGESGTASGVPVVFEDFEREGTMGDVQQGFAIRARVKVGEGANATIVRPGISMKAGYGMTKLPADLPGGGSVTLGNVDPNAGTAEIVVVPAGGAGAAPEVLAVELSTKPLIGLVWVGMFTLLSGAALGIRRRLALRAATQGAVAAAARVAAAP